MLSDLGWVIHLIVEAMDGEFSDIVATTGVNFKYVGTLDTGLLLLVQLCMTNMTMVLNLINNLVHALSHLPKTFVSCMAGMKSNFLSI